MPDHSKAPDKAPKRRQPIKRQKIGDTTLSVIRDGAAFMLVTHFPDGRRTRERHATLNVATAAFQRKAAAIGRDGAEVASAVSSADARAVSDFHAAVAQWDSPPTVAEALSFFLTQKQSLATAGTVDFSGTDAMTIVSGIQKTSDTGARDICSLGATPYVSDGTFILGAPAFSAPSLGYSSRGTAGSSNNVNNATYKAPWTGVFTGQSDISADQLLGRANGVQVFTAASDQGTGNYINDVLYIGGRAGTANFYSGGLYQLIVRGANTTAPDLTSGETFTATKTGVTL